MAETEHTPGLTGYEVTREGRVFSIAHNWRGYGRREMRQNPNRYGYPCVRLTINGKRTQIPVHRLVAAEYLPPRPSPKHEIRHLDGNKNNAHCDNLAWGTAKENAEDRERHGRTSRGASHSAAIKASAQAEGVRAYHKSRRETLHV